MKALIEKFQQGLDAFCKNDYYAKLYESAPDDAKRWLEAEFAYSYAVNNSSEDKGDEDNAPDPDEHLYKDGMTAEGWKWLAKYDSHHPKQKEYFLKMAAEAEKKA